MIRGAFSIIALAVLFLLTGLPSPALAQTEAPASSFLPADDSAAQSREDELYNDGTTCLNESKWEKALDNFTQVASLHGKRSDGALYWKAYSLNKLSRRKEALTTIAELQKQYPRSTWLKDAGALELEVKQDAGQPVNPATHTDDDTKLLALNSLMDNDPERAIPILKKFLLSNNSPRLKEQALFVLAPSDSSEAQQILMDIARGQSQPDLQRRATEYLATQDSAEGHHAALGEIYKSSSSRDVRRTILNAYVACDCRKELLAAVRQEQDPDLRRQAIQNLGATGATEELRQFYRSTTSVEDKEAVIQGYIAADDFQGLEEAARTATDVVLKSTIIRAFSAVDSEKSRPALLQMYATETNPEVKRAIIQALFAQDAAHDLVQLDRKETDPEMHRYLVQQLSVMDEREAKDYMLEILNK